MLKFYKFSLNPCYTIVAPTKGLPYPILEWSIRTWSPFRVTPKNNNGNHITLLEVKEPKTKLRNNKKTKTQSFRERTSSAVMIALICWLKKKKKTAPKSIQTTSKPSQKKKTERKDWKLTSRFRTIALSRPNIVEGYDSSGSRIRRSLAWICIRCMIAYLSASKIALSPVQSSRIQLLETTFFFRAAWRSDATAIPSRAISEVGFTSAEEKR